jgi:hypothetical protein
MCMAKDFGMGKIFSSCHAGFDFTSRVGEIQKRVCASWVKQSQAFQSHYRSYLRPSCCPERETDRGSSASCNCLQRGTLQGKNKERSRCDASLWLAIDCSVRWVPSLYGLMDQGTDTSTIYIGIACPADH